MSLMDNVKQLDSKQKMMLLATVGCLGLVFYLGYTTFFPSTGESNPTPQPISTTQSLATPSANTVSVQPVTQQPAPVSNTETLPDTISQNNQNANMTIEPASAPTPENLALLAESQQMQQQYVNLVNAYQLAQIQQKLTQVNAQIVASKLTAAKSMVELKKLQPLLGETTDTSLLSGASSSSDTAVKEGGYHTLYVGQVSGRWQAMLQGYGQYFQVNSGMHLPDGSVVTQINNRGVILRTSSGTAIFLPMSKSLD